MSMAIQLPFADRAQAGRLLAAALRDYAGRSDALVLALPRGGVPVAFEIAAAIHAPLDLLLVRKLGTPGHPELAMGAIASGGVRVLNWDVVEACGISEAAIEVVERQEHRELERRERVYRGDRAPPQFAGRCVIVVDDGIATGATMRAAVQALRQGRPGRIVVAVPVGARETIDALRQEADDVTCLAMPEPFTAIGCWYRKFPPTSDEEVKELLGRASGLTPAACESDSA